MTSIDCRRVITLSDRTGTKKREKNEPPAQPPKSSPGKGKDAYFDTLFGLLGEKRQPVIAFIAMKLDRRRRAVFREALSNCGSLPEECRCVRAFIRHLPMKDLQVLLGWIRRLLAGATEAIAFPGEPDPERRLAKFARTFGLAEAEVDGVMLYCLLAS